MRLTRDALQGEIAMLATKLAEAKTPEDKNSISDQLSDLARKLTDTEARVGSIEAYLKLVKKADDGSNTITYLQNKVAELERKLATASAKAGEIQSLTGK